MPREPNSSANAPRSPHTEVLSRAWLVARVVNLVDAGLKGYDPMSYNFTENSDGFSGGRFDKDLAHPGSWGYLYVGHGSCSLAAATAEVLADKVSQDGTVGQTTIEEAELESLGFQYLRVAHACRLLRLLDPSDCSRAAVPADICVSSDYDWTRRWGNHLREHVGGIHGLRYSSRRTLGGSSNIVLFSDRCKQPPLLGEGSIHPYRGSGRMMLRAACRELGYRIMP